MESLILLLYSKHIPPHSHLQKLAKKYITIYLKEREKQTFKEENYVEITIEKRLLGDTKRNFQYPVIIPVHKNYVQQVVKIFGDLNVDLFLCSNQHEHPIVYVDGKEHEGYCYYSLETDDKILFFESEDVILKKQFIIMPKGNNPAKIMHEIIIAHR